MDLYRLNRMENGLFHWMDDIKDEDYIWGR
jgi:hypothetical protein